MSIIEKALPSDIKRKWAELVRSRDSPVDNTYKFPSLLDFLQSKRSAIEYESVTLRATSSNQYYKGTAHYTGNISEEKEENIKELRPKCLTHDNRGHWASDCRLYQAKTIEEKKTIATHQFTKTIEVRSP